MTAPVPPPPPQRVASTNAASWWQTGRAWTDRQLGRNGTIAAIVAATLLIALIVACSMWAWNYNSSVTWEGNAREARAERDTAQAELAGVQSKADTLEAASDTMEAKIETLESEAASVAQRATELETQAAALAEREAAVTATEQQVAANTIMTGTWTVGVDIEPGTYKVTAPVTTGTCYWKISTTGTNGGDIVENDIVSGGLPQVNLSAGQDFTTERCGDWLKQ